MENSLVYFLFCAYMAIFSVIVGAGNPTDTDKSETLIIGDEEPNSSTEGGMLLPQTQSGAYSPVQPLQNAGYPMPLPQPNGEYPTPLPQQPNGGYPMPLPQPNGGYPMPPTPIHGDCTEVSVKGDATYCISLPVCSGSGSVPENANCPTAGTPAIRDCLSHLSSAREGNVCVAPVDAQCVKVLGDTWGCAFVDPIGYNGNHQYQLSPYVESGSQLTTKPSPPVTSFETEKLTTTANAADIIAPVQPPTAVKSETGAESDLGLNQTSSSKTGKPEAAQIQQPTEHISQKC